jgi:hypothetical protein
VQTRARGHSLLAQHTNVLSVCLQGGQPAEGRGRGEGQVSGLGTRREDRPVTWRVWRGETIVYSAAPDVSTSPPPGGGSHSPHVEAKATCPDLGILDS